MRWFWVDQFTEYVAGSHAIGVKGVSLSDEFLHDHWDIYPAMPNSLIAEGMAQTSGLLVSELYDFQELVVLAKFTRLSFSGLVRPGETIAYHATIGRVMDAGAQCEVKGTIMGADGPRPHSEAEIFFARLPPSDGAPSDNESDPSGTNAKGLPRRLFDPEDLVRWLQITGVFNVGVKADGTRMKPEDYGLPVLL